MLDKTNPLSNLNCKIGIIGAGPAGVHMASLLKKKGYKNIILFEKETRIGGKSCTVFDNPDDLNSTPHELGTCYLHSRYDAIFDLLKEYDTENTIIPFATNDRGVIGTRFRNLKNNEDDIIPFVDWLLHKIGEKVTPKDFSEYIDENILSGTEALSGGVELLDAVKLYSQKYMELFGIDHIESGFPPKPSQKSLDLMNMTFLDFLKKHKLEALVPPITFAHSFQGYGVLSEIPAFYGLYWVRPKILEHFVSFHSAVLKSPAVMMLKYGYSHLWEKIVDKHDLDINFGVTITSIDRNINNDKTNKIIINYEQEIEDKDEKTTHKKMEVDVLFMAINQKLGLKLFKNPQELEKKIFNALNGYILSATLYETDVEWEEKASEIWPDALNKAEGDLFAHRNSAKIVRKPEYKAVEEKAEEVERNDYGKGDEKENEKFKDRVVAYQFLNRDPKYETEPPSSETRLVVDEKYSSDIKFLRDKLHRDLEKCGEKNFKVLKQCSWPYFPHWELNDITNNHYPWVVKDEMQGKYNNTYYIGSSVCFESVLTVVEYNNILVDDLGI